MNLNIFRRSINSFGNDDFLLPTSSQDAQYYESNEKKTLRNAVFETFIALMAACVFGVFTWIWKGESASVEYFTGYIIEQSLSIDNLFVFLLLFEYFKVPLQYQSRVLSWGILGAVLLRGVMIIVGVAAVSKFKWLSVIFAGILIFSSYKIFKEGNDGDDGDLSNNSILKFSRYLIKSTTEYDGNRFFTSENGSRIATPLLMCLICIELSDLVFAIDSIPAVLGVSKDPFVVYSSNIFAIIGLRSLYTIVSKAMHDLHYLKPAVALILGFVGIKMIAEYFDYSMPNELALFIVFSMIGGGVVASLVYKKKQCD